VQSTFNKYSSVYTKDGTAASVARRILDAEGLSDVAIERVYGSLTDHYDPRARVLRLSDSVYDSSSMAAVGVAAHECGHAIQHAKAYAPLKMRSAMVPVVSFSSNIMSWVLLIGILTVQSMPGLLLAGIILFATTTLFSFITLPVEVDASRRALAWLQTAGITNSQNHKFACGALRSAAYTYVVAALSSLATLLYYVMIFLNRRD
jgi:Zn-dependent membrane protease YugP